MHHCRAPSRSRWPSTCVGGLERIDALQLDGYHYFHDARADLRRRLGHDAAARRRLCAVCGAAGNGAEARRSSRRGLADA